MITSSFQSLSNPAASASSHHLSATALLQQAATVGATQAVGQSHMTQLDMGDLGTVSQAATDSVSQISRQGSYLGNLAAWQKNDHLTRDFLGLTGDGHVGNGNVGNGNGGVNVSMNVREILTYTGGVGLQQYSERDHTMSKPRGFAYPQQPPPASETWGDC